MKEKSLQICVRTSQNEKKILQRKAKKCGLSLSTYLRKVGLEKEIFWVPDKDFYKIYEQLCDLKNSIYKLKTDEIYLYIEAIKKNFLSIYSGENKDGNNKNMGS